MGTLDSEYLDILDSNYMGTLDSEYMGTLDSEYMGTLDSDYYNRIYDNDVESVGSIAVIDTPKQIGSLETASTNHSSLLDDLDRILDILEDNRAASTNDSLLRDLPR